MKFLQELNLLSEQQKIDNAQVDLAKVLIEKVNTDDFSEVSESLQNDEFMPSSSSPSTNLISLQGFIEGELDRDGGSSQIDTTFYKVLKKDGQEVAYLALEAKKITFEQRQAIVIYIREKTSDFRTRAVQLKVQQSQAEVS